MGAVNQRPFSGPGFPPIVEKYHVCDRCASLDGGIYGKGPTLSFRTDQGRECKHEWRAISRAEFRSLATSRFKVDWSKEAAFWASEN